MLDKRFPPPSDSVLNAVCLLIQAVCEAAKVADDSDDPAGLRVAKTQYEYLDQVYEAMLERRRGATVH